MHKVSNAWQLTKRSGVRILFGEPNISHFEMLSGLLVNDAVPFTGKNGPYCRRAASLKLGPHRLLTCSDWLAGAFSRWKSPKLPPALHVLLTLRLPKQRNANPLLGPVAFVLASAAVGATSGACAPTTPLL